MYILYKLGVYTETKTVHYTQGIHTSIIQNKISAIKNVHRRLVYRTSYKSWMSVGLRIRYSIFMICSDEAVLGTWSYLVQISSYDSRIRMESAFPNGIEMHISYAFNNSFSTSPLFYKLGYAFNYLKILGINIYQTVIMKIEQF